MEGLTFDTGALIALEGRRQRMSQVLAVARAENIRVTVPTPVLVEWWRGQTTGIRAILRGLIIEPLTQEIAMMAGEALGRMGRKDMVDGVVMASAALRGDVVYTSDIDDLTALQSEFPNVRVLRC